MAEDRDNAQLFTVHRHNDYPFEDSPAACPAYSADPAFYKCIGGVPSWRGILHNTRVRSPTLNHARMTVKYLSASCPRRRGDVVCRCILLPY